ncbi:hypothetical protein [Anaerotignum propionicum]|uniref:hypothetical protein n=1 Tax=Anaerotignum propionicum TaxID=28446 RepID=UPI0028A0075C|nr:hypothetical protein [Anaerotignum propionicum]
MAASITNNYPFGAAMFLEYGNSDIRFKYRTIQGSDAQNVVPTELILDGQQRLTSNYSAMYSEKPVNTRTDKGKEIERFYYLDIRKCGGIKGAVKFGCDWAIPVSAEKPTDDRITTGEYRDWRKK